MSAKQREVRYGAVGCNAAIVIVVVVMVVVVQFASQADVKVDEVVNEEEMLG